MKILALTGIAGSGKTTLSNQLIDHGWEQTKFAAPIKSMITHLLLYQGVDYYLANRMIDGDLKEVPTQLLNGRTPRHAMQTLGTEWRELMHRNLWVDIWHRNILSHPSEAKIVVDDVRFHHEANTVISLGGKMVRIDRPENPLIATAGHISEIELTGLSVNGVIINNAKPEAMLRQLETIIGEL